MFIDETYFTRRQNVPQRGNTEGLQDLLSFVDQYEVEYLRCVLGLDLYDALAAGTEGSGTPDQRWIDLLTGKGFIYQGCKSYWGGLAPASKISPIANYVYWNYVDSKAEDFTLTGVVVSSTDNNRTVAPTNKLVAAWNTMVDMNVTLYRFLKASGVTYPEFKLCFTVDDCHGLDVYGCGYGCSCDCFTSSPCKRLFQKINSLGL